MKYELPDPLPPGNGITLDELAQCLAALTNGTYKQALADLTVALLKMQPNPTVLEALHDLGIEIIVFNKDVNHG